MEKSSIMKTLIITQAVDKDNYLIYPFFQWFRGIARESERCRIICLQKGEYDADEQNLEILSLGKEEGVWRFTYLYRLYKYTLSLFLKGEVDVLFVHMNEIYIWLLWPVTFLFRIPIVWWKAHGHLSKKSRKAIRLVRAIVTSSETGFPIDTPKRRILSQGIDTDIFAQKKVYSERVHELVSVSRISRIKHLEDLVDAMNVLVNEQGLDLHCNILGSAKDEDGELYLGEMKSLVEKYHLEKAITFVGAVRHEEVRAYYQRADIMVNTSNTRSLDKTVLEAMATGLMVVNSNIGFKEILAPFAHTQFEQGNVGQLASHVQAIAHMSPADRKGVGSRLRQVVIDEHNVNALIRKITVVLREVSKK